MHYNLLIHLSILTKMKMSCYVTSYHVTSYHVTSWRSKVALLLHDIFLHHCEEADDSMMSSIHQLYKKYSINNPLFNKDSISITVVTPDTDVFVVLMYNLENTVWKDLGIYLLKKGQIIIPQKPQQELYPLRPPSFTLQIRS